MSMHTVPVVSSVAGLQEMFRSLGFTHEPVESKGCLCHMGIVQHARSVQIAFCVDNAPRGMEVILHLNGIPAAHTLFDNGFRMSFARPEMVIYKIVPCTKPKRKTIVVNVAGKRGENIYVEICLPKTMRFHRYPTAADTSPDSRFIESSNYATYKKGLNRGKSLGYGLGLKDGRRQAAASLRKISVQHDERRLPRHQRGQALDSKK